MKNQKLTSKSSWAGRKAAEHVTSVPFQEIFHQYLEQSPGKTCLEIGCVPGKFLTYICLNFGYRAEGIDYLEGAADIVHRTLANNGIHEATIHEVDFLEFTPTNQYELVCSFGFIEHFAGQLNSEVVAKHVELVKNGGTLFLEVPNFRLGQYLIHRMLNPKKFESHNLETMKLSYFRKIAKTHNLRIRYLGYAGGFFDYWTSLKNPRGFQLVVITLLNWLKTKSARSEYLRKLNNRFFSPVLVFIADKI